jgi:hypothetical protein
MFAELVAIDMLVVSTSPIRTEVLVSDGAYPSGDVGFMTLYSNRSNDTCVL